MSYYCDVTTWHHFSAWWGDVTLPHGCSASRGRSLSLVTALSPWCHHGTTGCYGVTAGGVTSPPTDRCPQCLTRVGPVPLPAHVCSVSLPRTPPLSHSPMAAPDRPLSLEQQLAASIARVLSRYHFLLDSFVIEFFTNDQWATLPPSWQDVLADLPSPQLAALLLEKANLEEASYSMVWPLSLLAFKATAHALALPRAHCSGANGRPEEFQENLCQSARLHPVFRKHVKPKKQHEIWQLGKLVKRLSELAQCDHIVDVGSGQGHLSRFLSFGLGLPVTAVEGNKHLVDTAKRFDRELVQALKKEQARGGKAVRELSLRGPSHVAGWVDPQAPWPEFLLLLQPGVDMSHPPTAAACAGPPSLEPGMRTLPMVLSRDVAQPGRATADPMGARSHIGTGVPIGHLQEPSQPAEHPPAPGRVLLTGLHACGDLSVTLLRHFVHCPHVAAITSVACCYMKLSTRETPVPPGLVLPPTVPPATYGYPLSAWVAGLPGHTLSYKAREGACHAAEDYGQRLRSQSPGLRAHCYRAVLETLIRAADPSKQRLGVQTIPGAHCLSFHEYARLGLARVGLDPSTPLDVAHVDALLRREQQVIAYFTLALLLAPVVESLILLDRAIYLQEQGFQCRLIPLFDPQFSPRNLVLVAAKAQSASALSTLVEDDSEG
ncbi:PREDICTED: protein RRNAD1 [Gavialis gangeticus]|uniref:protein RRNAD1 n=1 Tax=Gavialis gangeticus TaxID=94835 RepID=UPI00092E882C|nr:PREDICTED: protein RRNAD1 [Gavialis gangeticus]